MHEVVYRVVEFESSTKKPATQSIAKNKTVQMDKLLEVQMGKCHCNNR